MIEVIISLAALIVAGLSFRSQSRLASALEVEKREKAELKSTLVELLDADGTVRGQLRLPGESAAAPVAARLAIAERSISTILSQVDKANAALAKAAKDLEASRAAEARATKTLAEVTDRDGKVLAQIRLPGAKVTPNRTPCGGLCTHAAWHAPWRDWICHASQGMKVSVARPQFLDGHNQCTMWERKK